MKKSLLTALLFSSLIGLTQASEFEVGQKNKSFTTDELTIKAGDTVSFPNQDPFFHNVFSLSEIKSFDLGSYKQGDTKKIVFYKPGTVDVECAIHPKMYMKITVK